MVQLSCLGLPFDRRSKEDILAAGLALMDEVNSVDRPGHPEDPDINGLQHVQFIDHRHRAVLPRSDRPLPRGIRAVRPRLGAAQHGVRGRARGARGLIN
ncbi:hypothetical protein [Streptomyces sp. NPDC014622]|uniref:hypothetical protein n=1 Tax=Streptomyces sp. NPDC014622 TaxID=3364874 RepID=UPI0036FCC014